MITTLASSNPMTNSEGWTITTVYLVLAVLLVAAKLILRYKVNKFYPLQNALMIVLALLPSSYMFLLGDRWEFGPNYLPTGNPPVDISYSSFHFAFLIFMILGAIALALIGLKHRDDTSTTYFKGRLTKIDYTVFRIGLLLVSIEVYKQLIHANLWYGLDKYSWSNFPLQFCSVPLFFFIIAPWLKNATLKKSIYEFIALFVTVAGLAVMVVGGSVFTADVSISVHTMLWHGGMVVAGVYLIFALKIGTDLKQLLRSTIFLGVLIVLVQIVNIHFHYMGEYIENGPGSFSGFFISPWNPYYDNIPVLGKWQQALYESAMPRAISATIYSFIYYAVFTLGASLIYAFIFALRKIVNLGSNKKKRLTQE
jgi:hypothetical protein